MSETAARWLLGLMIAWVLLFVLVGIVGRFVYRRRGYPTKPSFMKEIRLRDDIETIVKKLAPAFQNGFVVKDRTDEHLLIEKQHHDPPSIMTIEFDRPFGSCPWSVTYVMVKCPNHPMCNWRWSDSTNAIRRKKPQAIPPGTDPETTSAVRPTLDPHTVQADNRAD